jgi:hypothetical protein
MKPSARYGKVWVLSGAAVLVIIVWVFIRSNEASGDPGGRLMNQLTPTVSAIPGDGRLGVPWVSEPPQSMTAPYAIMIEPHQSSCDGRAATRGWSQVAVQAQFSWTKSFSALISYMNPRLMKLGWSLVAHPPPSDPPNRDWTKTLKNGARAELNIEEMQGNLSSQWQLYATTRPVGKAANGC